VSPGETPDWLDIARRGCGIIVTDAASLKTVSQGGLMIFITAKFQIRPEDADQWPQISAEFTEATRSEPGCLWFDWSRSLDDPEEYVLVEAFRDGDAGAAHVQSDHFKKAQQTLPPHLARTPRIVNFTIPQDDWSLLGELAVPDGD
jgi:quinol monooxygenase YgiN